MHKESIFYQSCDGQTEGFNWEINILQILHVKDRNLLLFGYMYHVTEVAAFTSFCLNLCFSANLDKASPVPRLMLMNWVYIHVVVMLESLETRSFENLLLELWL